MNANPNCSSFIIRSKMLLFSVSQFVFTSISFFYIFERKKKHTQQKKKFIIITIICNILATIRVTKSGGNIWLISYSYFIYTIH